MGGVSCRDAKLCVSPETKYCVSDNVYHVSMGTKPDFWEANWHKIITATAVLVGIYATLHK